MSGFGRPFGGLDDGDDNDSRHLMNEHENILWRLFHRTKKDEWIYMEIWRFFSFLQRWNLIYDAIDVESVAER